MLATRSISTFFSPSSASAWIWTHLHANVWDLHITASLHSTTSGQNHSAPWTHRVSSRTHFLVSCSELNMKNSKRWQETWCYICSTCDAFMYLFHAQMFPLVSRKITQLCEKCCSVWTHPASRLWALREADPDSVPLSASLSLWYSTGDVEPGLIRTAERTGRGE